VGATIWQGTAWSPVKIYCLLMRRGIAGVESLETEEEQTCLHPALRETDRDKGASHNRGRFCFIYKEDYYGHLWSQ